MPCDNWAARKGSFGAIEILKTAGALSTVENIKGWTPHSVAVFHHKVEILNDLEDDQRPQEGFSLRTLNVAPGFERSYRNRRGCWLVSLLSISIGNREIS